MTRMRYFVLCFLLIGCMVFHAAHSHAEEAPAGSLPAAEASQAPAKNMKALPQRGEHKFMPLDQRNKRVRGISRRQPEAVQPRRFSANPKRHGSRPSLKTHMDKEAQRVRIPEKGADEARTKKKNSDSGADPVLDVFAPDDDSR